MRSGSYLLIFQLCTGTSFFFAHLLLFIQFVSIIAWADEPVRVASKGVRETVVHAAREVSVHVPESLWSYKQYDLAFGSGLALGKNGLLWGVTDRGPIIGEDCQEGVVCNGLRYALDDFSPLIVSLHQSTHSHEYQANSAIPIHETLLEKKSMPGKRSGMICNQEHLLDPEGVAIDQDGYFWIVEESNPALLKVHPQSGAIQRRYVVGNGLPHILKYSQQNKSFEGIAVAEDGDLWIALQAPLALELQDKGQASVIRLVKFSPESERAEMYAYSLHHISPSHRQEVKVSAIEAISDSRLLLLERVHDGESERSYLTLLSYKGLVPLKEQKKKKKEIESRTSLAKFEDSLLKTISRTPLQDEWCGGFRKFEGMAYDAKRSELILAQDADFGVTDEESCEPSSSSGTTLCILNISLASAFS